jgi:RES domain-containing protein
MQIWRICRRRFAKRAYNGEGARLAGGRWNHRGELVAYASPALSLAALELFVNLRPPHVPDDLVSVPAILPDDVTSERWEVKPLPKNWRDAEPPPALRDLGSEWIHSLRTAVLFVPSVVVPEEFNVLLNPAHPEFTKLQVGQPRKFQFDARMWKR